MSRRATRVETGLAGEDAAAHYLRKLGYRVVARNLRTRHAEIDILMRRRSLWVAVEVKTRRRHPAPERCVEIEQIEGLAQALQKLCTTLRPRPKELRIDIVAVRLLKNGPEIRHFPGRSWMPPKSTG